MPIQTDEGIMQESKSAIDVIYDIYQIVSEIRGRILSLESRVQSLELSSKQGLVNTSNAGKAPSKQSTISSDSALKPQESDSEIMDIVLPSVSTAPRPVVTAAPPTIKNEPVIVEGENEDIFDFTSSSRAPQPAKPKRETSKIFGKLRDVGGKPLIDVGVTVTDPNGKVVKGTKTNRAGEWMCFLSPGDYAVEFTKPGMRPQFKAIKILPGQGEIEIQ